VLNLNGFEVPGSEMFALKSQIRVSDVNLEYSLPNAVLQVVLLPHPSNSSTIDREMLLFAILALLLGW
jgi:hypothetical protein